MAFPFAALIPAVGGVLSSIIGIKKDQAEVIKASIDAVGTTQSAAARELAELTSVVKAEASSSNILASSWRPILMYICMGMVVSFWFGYVPPHIDKPMSPMMLEIFGFIKLGLGGYMGGRTLEKIVSTFGNTKIIQTYIEKKLLG